MTDNAQLDPDEDRRERMEWDYEAKKKIYRDLRWLRSRIDADKNSWIRAQITSLEGKLEGKS